MFKVGDRVRSTVDYPDNNENIVRGDTGTVVHCEDDIVLSSGMILSMDMTATAMAMLNLDMDGTYTSMRLKQRLMMSNMSSTKKSLRNLLDFEMG